MAALPPETSVPQTLEDLPDEVLSRIFDLLSPLHLSWLERVSKRCRTLVVHHGIWHHHCLRAHPAIASATATGTDASQVPWGRPAGTSSAVEGTSMASEPSTAFAAAAAPAGPAGARQAAGEAVSAEQASAFYKRLHFRLTAPQARESLLAEALAATSTDHPQENVSNTLRPSSRSRDLMCYWSSRGSEDPDSCEALAFRLAHPLCLVTEVQLRPFKAFFQWGAPIYAPHAMRFRLGGISCFDSAGAPLPRAMLRGPAHFELHRRPPAPAPPTAEAAGDNSAAVLQQQAAQPEPEAVAAQGAAAAQQELQARQQQWVWESPVYPVENRDELQRFPIPPTLCVGGYVRVELLGKQQRQSVDDAYYTCICYVRVVGSPVYNFMLRPLGPFSQQQQQPQQQQEQAAGRQQLQQQQQETGTQRLLAYLSPDPLLEAGGLVAVSEGGRLAGGSGSESEGDEEEDDDSSLAGNSEDYDFSDMEGEEADGAALMGPPVGFAQQPGEGGAAGGGSGNDDEWPIHGDAGAY